MNAAYRTTCFAVCLALIGCGNKGDLYLQEIELSAEQKAVLDNRDLKEDNEEDVKKTKKKKADANQTTEQN